MKIIGYIHICQKKGWVKSLKLLLDSLYKSELYEATKIIRIGIVNDDGHIIDHKILHDNKFKILFMGKSEKYERPTLLHMRQKSGTETAYYWYLHTKGLRHFGTDIENNVIDWIKIMLHCNITYWNLAVNKLNEGYDTYGCNLVHTSTYPYHYSGNFWWTTSKYVHTLSKKIGSAYCDPEFWILTNKNVKTCNIYETFNDPDAHYNNRFTILPILPI